MTCEDYGRICPMTDQNECKRRMMTRLSLILSRGLVPWLASSSVFKHKVWVRQHKYLRFSTFKYSCYISVGKILGIWLRAVVWLLIRVHLNPAQLTLLPARSFSPGFGSLKCVTVFVHVLDMSVKGMSLTT